MNPSQQKAWDNYHETFLLPIERCGHSTSVASGQQLDFEQIFDRKAKLVVEIGSGAGKSLVAAAAKHRDTDFLAFEVYQPAIATTLGLMAKSDITNVRIVQADAVAGLEILFAKQSIAELWTFFPDPWRKKRHHKRRLIQPDFVKLVAEKMAPGALWRIATDWQDYADHVLDVFNDQQFFANQYPDYAPRFSGREITRFEQRGLDAGRKIYDFTFKRLP